MKRQPSNSTNIVLWIMQIVLAFWTLTGAIYMIGHYEDLATLRAMTLLPQFVWWVLGGLEILCAIGLVIPKLTPYAAIGLTIFSLLGSILYAAYTGSGIFWALIPAGIAAYIAYKRWPASTH